jgi:hypothetical protein
MRRRLFEMRKPLAVLFSVTAVFVAAVAPPAVAEPPEAACNQGTAHAHETVPEENAVAHEHIPECH